MLKTHKQAMPKVSSKHQSTTLLCIRHINYFKGLRTVFVVVFIPSFLIFLDGGNNVSTTGVIVGSVLLTVSIALAVYIMRLKNRYVIF